MKVEIITIGDEILIGQIIDTNSAWMAQQLNEIGVKVERIVTISDKQAEIIEALRGAEVRADVVLVTGGLGPTKDDVTKKALSDYFECGATFYPEIAKHIERLFVKFGKEITELNRLQAELPSACQPLHNELGTAPGMWFETNDTVFVCMPGVPYEMKGIMTNHVLPRIVKDFKLPTIIHKTVLTMGMGESWLSERIAAWEDALPEQIKLAYLPSPDRVRLRLSAIGNAEKALSQLVAKEVEKLRGLIPNLIFGYDNETIEEVIGQLLRAKKLTVSTAESCTGGRIASLITSISGSSDYYLGSVVSYSNTIKMQELRVLENDLIAHGAVSEEVVKQMAVGARAKLKTDYAIATSGIAGPDGGTDEKPVGTVWISIAGPTRTVAKKFQFGHDRKRNIEISAKAALNLLRKELVLE
ncbi:competence/damage-inducible protein A [Bacteroidota bacterium]